MRAALKQTPDISRSLTRLSLQRGGPRDLAAIRDALCGARTIAEQIDANSDLGVKPSSLGAVIVALEDRSGEGFRRSQKPWMRRSGDAPALLARDGGFIAKGFDAGLDEVRVLRDQSRRVIAGLEAQYREMTSLKGAKNSSQQCAGVFLSKTPPSHGDKLMASPFDETFIHRQTLGPAPCGSLRESLRNSMPRLPGRVMKRWPEN